MEPAQRNILYRGALERYARAPPENRQAKRGRVENDIEQKPRVRFPWGLLIGLLILILTYYIVSKLVFR